MTRIPLCVDQLLTGQYPQEMVEPLEETRTEIIFATEPVLSSLHLSIPGSLQYSPLVELDEIEVGTGIFCPTFVHFLIHLRGLP